MESVLITPSGWVLLPWVDGDVAALREALAPEDAERQLGGVLASDAAATQWIGDRRSDWAGDHGYSWAVHSPGGELAGSVTVSAIDRRQDTGWVSYWTSGAARGRGVATEASALVARWALTSLGLFRLELGHRVNNPASCAVATAAGFRTEGVQRAKLRYGAERFSMSSCTPGWPPTWRQALSTPDRPDNPDRCALGRRRRIHPTTNACRPRATTEGARPGATLTGTPAARLLTYARKPAGTTPARGAPRLASLLTAARKVAAQVLPLMVDPYFEEHPHDRPGCHPRTEGRRRRRRSGRHLRG